MLKRFLQKFIVVPALGVLTPLAMLLNNGGAALSAPAAPTDSPNNQDNASLVAKTPLTVGELNALSTAAGASALRSPSLEKPSTNTPRIKLDNFANSLSQKLTTSGARLGDTTPSKPLIKISNNGIQTCVVSLPNISLQMPDGKTQPFFGNVGFVASAEADVEFRQRRSPTQDLKEWLNGSGLGNVRSTGTSLFSFRWGQGEMPLEVITKENPILSYQKTGENCISAVAALYKIEQGVAAVQTEQKIADVAKQQALAMAESNKNLPTEAINFVASNTMHLRAPEISKIANERKKVLKEMAADGEIKLEILEECLVNDGGNACLNRVTVAEQQQVKQSLLAKLWKKTTTGVVAFLKGTPKASPSVVVAKTDSSNQRINAPVLLETPVAGAVSVSSDLNGVQDTSTREPQGKSPAPSLAATTPVAPSTITKLPAKAIATYVFVKNNDDLPSAVKESLLKAGLYATSEEMQTLTDSIDPTTTGLAVIKNPAAATIQGEIQIFTRDRAGVLTAITAAMPTGTPTPVATTPSKQENLSDIQTKLPQAAYNTVTIVKEGKVQDAIENALSNATLEARNTAKAAAILVNLADRGVDITKIQSAAATNDTLFIKTNDAGFQRFALSTLGSQGY